MFKEESKRMREKEKLQRKRVLGRKRRREHGEEIYEESKGMEFRCRGVGRGKEEETAEGREEEGRGRRRRKLKRGREIRDRFLKENTKFDKKKGNLYQHSSWSNYFNHKKKKTLLSRVNAPERNEKNHSLMNIKWY